MFDKFELTKEQNIFLAKKQLIQSIYNSAKVEGLNVTFPETQTILNGVNVGSVPLDEIECILNLRNAWKFTLNNIDKPFDLDFICKVNNEVSRNESLEWGKLRNGSVGISGTDYLPPIPMQEQVQKDIEDILSQGSTTEQAINYFLYGTRKQLFWDGNKRTSSICANKILIANGAGIFTIPDKFLIEFNQHLTDYYNTNNKEPISEFLYDKCIIGMQIQRTPENAIEEYCNKVTEQNIENAKTNERGIENGR